MEKNTLCCLALDKMNRPTLALRFEVSFAQQPLKYDLEKNLVARTFDIR